MKNGEVYRLLLLPKMDDQQIIDYVLSRRYKTIDKVYPSTKAKFPEVTKKQVQAILKGERVKDISTNALKKNKKYMNKTFDNHRYGYMMDILINKPHMYLVFIGTNTRWAKFYQINDRTTSTVKGVIKKFIESTKVVSLTSDSEPAFLSKEVLKLLNEHNIDVRIITESRTTGLSVLNRFFRTIRDMAGNEALTPALMNELFNVHNSTVHSSTGMAPNDMKSSKQAEDDYIFRMLEDQSGIEKKEGFKITPGSKVRLVLPKKKMNKTRYNVSPDYYTISDKEGLSFIATARDGSTKTVSRAQIVTNVPKASKHAKTFEGETSRGTVSEILQYYPKKEKYRVKYEMPDGSEAIDTIPVSYLRSKHPLRRTQLELEYFAKAKSKTVTSSTKASQRKRKQVKR